MASASPEPCFDDAPGAALVARGVNRLFFRQGDIALCEVSLGNGRRADIMALDARGTITIVEIKISRADLLGDAKWPEYLDYCDRFYWAVPPGFDLGLFDREAMQPECCGLIVADAYDAAIVRGCEQRKVAGSRRRAETLRFARRAAARLLFGEDPHLGSFE